MANISQLKAVYLYGHDRPFYVILMVFLISSIILQIVAGLLMIFLGTLQGKIHLMRVYANFSAVLFILGRININVPDNAQHRKAEILSTCFLAAIFLLTLINIFISSLGINDGYPGPKENDERAKSSFTNNETNG